MYVRDKCGISNNIILLDNCTFDSISTVNQPVVHVVLLQDKNFISFNNCTFKHNYAEDSSVVSLEIKVASDITCNQAFKQNLLTPSNIQFRENKFIRNYGKLLSLVNTEKNKRTLYITGPTSIIQNEASAHHHSDLISVQNMVAYIYGPLNISHNSARAYSIWKLNCVI